MHHGGGFGGGHGGFGGVHHGGGFGGGFGGVHHGGLGWGGGGLGYGYGGWGGGYGGYGGYGWGGWGLGGAGWGWGWGGGYYRSPIVVPIYNPVMPLYYNTPYVAPPVTTTVVTQPVYQGMPPPQQGMPQQGMPPQGMPQQGMPPQGMPQQGMPPPQQGGQQPLALRSSTYSKDYPIIRYVPVTKVIARHCTIELYKHIPLYAVMLIYDSQTKMYRLANEHDKPPCAPEAHLIDELNDYTEVKFNDPQENTDCTLLACSYCRNCGQHFFIQPPITEPPPS